MSNSSQFTLSGWGYILNALANGDIGLELDTQSLSFGFVLRASWVPLVMLVASLIIAFVTMVRLLCCSPKLQNKRGKSVAPSLVWALLSFVVVIVGLIIFMATAQRGFAQTNDVLNDLSADVGNASSVASSLNMSLVHLQTNIHKLQETCPDLPASARQSLNSEVQSVLAELEAAAGGLSTYTNQLEAIAGEMDDLTSGRAQEIQSLSSGILSLPLIFVTLTCAFMTTILLGTSCLGHGSNCAKCQDIFFFKIGSIGLSLTILVVAVISTGQLASGIAISSFCGDIDGNMMIVLNNSIGEGSDFYAQHGSHVYNATTYYITGKGQNPFEDELKNASTTLAEANDTLSQLKDLLNTEAVHQSCGDAFSDPVNAINSDIANAFDQTQVSVILLSRNETIYPLYQEAMHKAVCGEVINGLGWLSLFQFVVGVLCLPCLSCTVASFVHRRAYERTPPVLEGVQVNLV